MVMRNFSRGLHERATKHLLDAIVLQLVSEKAKYGYEIMTAIKKTYGISFGASTIYPLLNNLEREKLIKSEWNSSGKRPRKIYCMTSEGKDALRFITHSLIQICRNLESAKSGEMSVAIIIGASDTLNRSQLYEVPSEGGK
jgi:PadR family transcriptional regulator, regulatory protein PadR